MSVKKRRKPRGFRYRDELIEAVENFLKQGITKSTEIAKRLSVSPYTVRNIKILLNKWKKAEPSKKKSREEIIMRILKRMKEIKEMEKSKEVENIGEG